MLIATFYAHFTRQRRAVVAAFATICVGIWWTAVYSGHHYIIDVLLGIATTIVGIALLEAVVFRTRAVSGWMERYVAAIRR